MTSCRFPLISIGKHGDAAREPHYGLAMNVTLLAR